LTPGFDRVDVAFALRGDGLTADHRRALAAALQHALPWLGDAPGTGIRLAAAAPAGARVLVSGRTRLVLRVPRERAASVLAIEGTTLDVDDARLQVGAGRVRELLPFGTLYAHVVAADGDADEAAFMRSAAAALDALDIAGRTICGRPRRLEAGTLHGYGLMVDGLDTDASLRLLAAGVGPDRLLGCGLFVPHKSAAAVGAARY
jgi:CRISPR-associated protein Cas6